ncbi:MAG: sugar phosphate isomerase/epimerase family protein [Thermoguttaceae bacterium]
MATLSMNETTTFRWSFEEDLAHYAAAGIPAIGVWRQKLSDCGEGKGIELLNESGLKVSHLFWAGGFTGSDGRSFRASIDDAADALRTAGTLGAESLVVYSGGRAGHTGNHARRLFQDAILELAPLARELNVVLAIEPMHPNCAKDFTFLTSLDDALHFLAGIPGSPAKLVLDTYHIGWDADLLHRIPQFAGEIALVQLGDAHSPPTSEQNRTLLSGGVVPLVPIIQALTAAGYDGYYDVELLGEEIETRDYLFLLDHAKAAFEKLVVLTK